MSTQGSALPPEPMHGNAAPSEPMHGNAAHLALEDAARAELYALLARLFYQGPDQALLRMIACADSLLQQSDASASQSQSTASAQLHSAWQALREAAAGENLAPVIRQEYEDVFVGVGKAEVTPYLSHYLDGMPGDRFLVRLRDALAALGLARAAGATEPEDHISGLFDTMRHLILRSARVGDTDADAGGDDHAATQQQKRFFEEFVRDAALKFCEAAQQSHKTAFYKRVSRIAESLLKLESEAFAMV